MSVDELDRRLIGGFNDHLVDANMRWAARDPNERFRNVIAGEREHSLVNFFRARRIAFEAHEGEFCFRSAGIDRWWPFAGGVYYLHGIKRVTGVRLITPQWKGTQVKKKALAVVPNKTNGRDDAMAARSNHAAGDSQ